ncbi:hypothetical protein IGI04_030863 [Brassica rapa subsp. trilocularis]|uniref:Uncharacterized protein n=1 Tax=Brassica rapa subsp. trilocularis TaxID=1813537 RepID=A0ABQ7LST4_BRACM|nr:hypothetical protein IGI04_030863 [Brassica rapa subsp. trilocularis]
MGFSRKDKKSSTLTLSLETLISSVNTHNSSYIYHGPQVHTVKESITSSTNAIFLVCQYPNNSILVK